MKRLYNYLWHTIDKQLMDAVFSSIVHLIPSRLLLSGFVIARLMGGFKLSVWFVKVFQSVNVSSAIYDYMLC